MLQNAGHTPEAGHNCFYANASDELHLKESGGADYLMFGAMVDEMGPQADTDLIQWAANSVTVNGTFTATGKIRTNDKYNVNGTDGISATQRHIVRIQENGDESIQVYFVDITYIGGIITNISAEDNYKIETD